MKRWLKAVLVAVAICLVAFVVIQLVPYRVTNPRATQEPAWDSPRTRRLAVAACFDCHSNQSHTTWWEDIAPLSWWITNHVRDGRASLNFSESGKRRGESDDAAETVLDGSMPPSYYTWLGMHPNAKLTERERRELAAGLKRTLAGG